MGTGVGPLLVLKGRVADVFNRIPCCLPPGFFSAVSLQLGLYFLLAAVFVSLACQEAMTFPLPIFLCFFCACALQGVIEI